MSSFDHDDLMSKSRENGFKKETENLKRDPHEKKQLVTPRDRNGDPVDLQRLLFDELLGREQRKCLRLKEMVIQLKEEKEKLTDHVKLVDNKRDRLFAENMKMENAKNTLISELGKSKRKCQELEGVVTQLTEEKRMLIDHVKMGDKKRDTISMQNIKMETEKNNLIFELGKSENKCQELEAAVTLLAVEKTMLTDHVKIAEEISMKMESEKNNLISEMINEVKKKNLESEELVRVYQDKCKCLGNNLAKMDQEMKQKKLEVEELKLANKAIKDSSLRKIESDKNSPKRMKMIRSTPNILQNSSKNFSYPNMNWGLPPVPSCGDPSWGARPAQMPSYGDPSWGARPAQGPVMGNVWGPPSGNQNHMQPQFAIDFRKGVVCPYNKNGRCRKGLQCDYKHT